jgi:hypothetical protein
MEICSSQLQSKGCTEESFMLKAILANWFPDTHQYWVDILFSFIVCLDNEFSWMQAKLR